MKTMVLKRVMKTLIMGGVVIFFSACATIYKKVEPTKLYYGSESLNKGVSLEYRYNILTKKYKKKEWKKNVKLVAVKIANNTDRDLVIGQDIQFRYTNGGRLNLMSHGETYKTLKQNPWGYLFYLFLLNLKFYHTPEEVIDGIYRYRNVVPIGFGIGPGLAFGNMSAVMSSNKKFKKELMEYNILGATVSAGKTLYGLIGVSSQNYDAIELEVQ